MPFHYRVCTAYQYFMFTSIRCCSESTARQLSVRCWWISLFLAKQAGQPRILICLEAKLVLMLRRPLRDQQGIRHLCGAGAKVCQPGL